jgi:NAD(P)-dependent dehydrogenase (short-subunit alcohol dehydrogenase family)
MRLAGKTAIVVGAGQSPGEGMGNGRATAITFARQGEKVLAVDANLHSAKETAALIAAEGGSCVALAADVTEEATLRTMVAEAMRPWNRIDILHNNVGVSLAGGDATPLEITEAAFDRVSAINLRGVVMACKYALPIMREHRRATTGFEPQRVGTLSRAPNPLSGALASMVGVDRVHDAQGRRGQCRALAIASKKAAMPELARLRFTPTDPSSAAP